MTCYSIPLIAAGTHYFMMKKNPSWQGDKYHKTLNQLLIGGAIFGFVDHLWHGELFLISDKILMDLLLGVTITAVIFLAAGVITIAEKYSEKKLHKVRAD